MESTGATGSAAREKDRLAVCRKVGQVFFANAVDVFAHVDRLKLNLFVGLGCAKMRSFPVVVPHAVAWAIHWRIEGEKFVVMLCCDLKVVFFEGGFGHVQIKQGIGVLEQFDSFCSVDGGLIKVSARIGTRSSLKIGVTKPGFQGNCSIIRFDRLGVVAVVKLLQSIEIEVECLFAFDAVVCWFWFVAALRSCGAATQQCEGDRKGENRAVAQPIMESRQTDVFEDSASNADVP